MDHSVLVDGLRGNNRLKSLIPPRVDSTGSVGNQKLLAIASALKENKGLVKMDLWAFTTSHETWDAVCDSLTTHPTLQVLNLMAGEFPLTPVVLESRIQALVDMLKVNMSIHTIHVQDDYSQHELFQGSVIPNLKTNMLRPRVRAIQITRPTAYRTKVLGRALLAVRTDANSFWMLLSGNAEVAFPSRTRAIVAAANLTTAVTASVTVGRLQLDS